MYCSFCGSQNLDESNYCVNCGKPLKNIKIQEEIKNEPEVQSESKDKMQKESVSEIQNQSPQVSGISKLSFWGSLFVIVGFFLNWINFGALGGISGFKILTTISGNYEEFENEILGDSLVFAFLLSLIILSAIICFIYSLSNIINSAFFIVFKILQFIALLISIVMILSQIGKVNIGDNGVLFKMIGIGFYVTAIGSFLLLISSSNKSQASSDQVVAEKAVSTAEVSLEGSSEKVTSVVKHQKGNIEFGKLFSRYKVLFISIIGLAMILLGSYYFLLKQILLRTGKKLHCFIVIA